MNKQNKNIYDEDESDYSSYEEFEIECEQSDSKIVPESKLEINYEAKSESKQIKETKQNKKKTIIQKINIEEENEEILCFNNPCVNCEINRELLHIVRNLSNKLNNIENELKELKNMITKKNDTNVNIIPPINKKNIMEWLNNYIVPTITFDEFVENIIVNMGHFEFLLEYKLADTIQKIIQINLIKNNKIIYPLYASTEKCGKVYVFTEDETWEIITIEYLSKFIKQIENQLSKHCIDWKNRYSGKNNFNSELQVRCQNAISKLYNISYTQDTMMNRVRHDLCEQLKIICK
jgi:hypothetical protein